MRVLSRGDVLALSFGAMIGWGWVVLTGSWIKEGGSLGAMLAFLIGSIMVIFVGLAYAELTPAMPKCGGEHVFSYRAMGVTGSFICTWAIILGYVSVVAFEAVALPTVLEYLFPNYKQGYLWTVAGWDVYATWVAVGVIGSVILTVINYLGIRPAAFLQNILTVMIGIVGLMLLGGGLFSGDTANMQPFFSNGLKGLFAVLIMTPFMFVGFDVIPQAAEEIKIPFKTIGKILIFSVFLAAFWYMMVIFAVSRALPLEQAASSKLPTADAMAALFGGSWAAKLLILGGIAGILTSWNSFYIGASRAIYAMAHARMLPGFLGVLHPKYKTPSNAILLIGLFSVMAPLFGRKMLVWLVDAGSLGIVIAWSMVSLSFLILRYREPEMKRPFVVPNGKLVGYLATVLSIGMILLYMPGTPSALVWPYEWLIFLGWSLLGIVFYIWARISYGNVADEIMRQVVLREEREDGISQSA